jgi:hypothetical protein
VFRGYTPGRHVSAHNLRYQLRDVFSARAARLGTLHELTKLAPIAIIAEMLGYSPATIERHAIASAACEPCLPEWHARDTGHLDHRHAVFGAPAQRLRADARDMLVQQPQASPFPVRLSPVP